jgi:hypothetical protein
VQPTEERWCPIDGTDGLYEVSDRGRVRSWNGAVRGSFRRRPEPRVLKPYKVAHDYLQVELRIGKRLVHRLVAEAFLGPHPANLTQVAHWNGDNQNNSVSNLRYTDKVGNEADKKRHGTARGRFSRPEVAA